jgi:hypothetical protein
MKGAASKRLVVHLDNCSVHASRISTDWLEEYSIPRMRYPPYSSDIASGDFYLFRTVNEKLERIQLADDDHHFECLQGVLRRMDLEELNAIFQAWVSRAQEVSEGNGDYVR